MARSTPSTDTVQQMFDHLGPPGTPFTTPEIAAEFECSDRTIYNRLDSLVDAGAIETKKVGAKGRVWWQPVRDDGQKAANGGSNTNPQSSYAAQLSLFHTAGEMAERIREFEWAKTPIGPIDDWPAQLRVAVEIMLGTSEAIGIYWGDEHTLLYNDGAAEQIGEKHPDALGQPARDVFPEAWEELGPTHEQVMAGEGPIRNEEHYLPLERSGELEDIWWDTSFNAIPGEDGSVGGVMNISFDVTERVQAERELRELKQKSEAKYRTLFESIDEGFCIVEMLFDEDDQPVDYRFLETNPTFEEITGLSDAEGERMRNLEPDHEDHWFEIYGKVARTGEDVRFTERAEHLDDRWYDVFAFRIGNSDEHQVAILFDDITERKRAKEALQENEARLDAFVTATSEVVYRMSPDWSEMYYLDGKDFIADTEDPRETWLEEYIPPDEEKRVMAAIEEAIETTSTFELEHQVVQVDGSRGWTHSRAVPVCSDDGEIVEWFGTATDITERKETGRKLQQQAELDAFRIDLADAIRSLVDPAKVQQEAARVLGEQLNVSRANYCEVLSEDGRVIVHSEYLHGDTPTAIGEHRLDEFGQHILESLQEGNSVVVDDLQTDPKFTEDQRTSYSTFDIQSLVAAPILKGGQCTAYVVVNEPTPRKWTDAEIEMVEETADRTWNAVQRAQAEQALRESEEKFRTLAETAPALIWQNDENGENQFINRQFLDFTGMSEEAILGEGWHTLVHPDERDAYVADYLAAVAEQRAWSNQNRLRRHDGEWRWFDNHAQPLFGADGAYQGHVGVSLDITGHKEAEQKLAAELETIKRLQEVSTQSLDKHEGDVLYESVLETTMDLLDADFGTIQRLDSQAHELDMLSYRGFSAETIAQWDRVDAETSSSCGRALQTEERVIIPDVETCEFIEDGEDLEAFTRIGIRSMQTTPLTSRSGELLGMLSTHWTGLHEPSERDRHLLDVIARQVADLMEQRAAYEAVSESEASLHRLNAMAQALIDAEPETISDSVPELTADVLDVEYATLWQYDEQIGTLDMASEFTEPESDIDAVRPSAVSHDRVWKTFIGDDIDVDDALDVAGDESWPSRLGSRVFVPLGRHGVVVVGAVQTETFEEWRLDLVEMVASTVETAWDRAESERLVEQRHEERTRLDRLNILIRRIDQGLVDAQTVEGIDEMVCTQLADSALFEFAWLGEYEANADDVLPRAWAGVDSVAVDELTATADGSSARVSPFVTAVQRGEMQVVADVATDVRAAPWRENTLGLGARSCLAIPLAYDDSIYGVLVVYGSQPQPDERDLDVLSELGRTVGHAIHAVETRHTSGSESSVELTIQTSTADTPLVSLSRKLCCAIEFEGLVPGADAETTVFFSARDVDPEAVVVAAEDSLAFEELLPLVEQDDGHRFKAQVIDEPFAGTFLERGGTIRSLTVDEGTVTAVVSVAGSTDVRRFIEGVRRDVPDLDLLARRSRRPSLETPGQLQTAFEARLTPRQQEILQLAYRSGYFETPRVQTGQDLSEALDLSQSTFNHHLRGAERRIFDVVFDSA